MAENEDSSSKSGWCALKLANQNKAGSQISQEPSPGYSWCSGGISRPEIQRGRRVMMHHRRIGDDDFGERAVVPSPFFGGRRKIGI